MDNHLLYYLLVVDICDIKVFERFKQVDLQKEGVYIKIVIVKIV